MSTPGPGERARPGTLDAFVSYSNLDEVAVRAVVEAARRRGRTMWVYADADAVPPGAPWRAELGTAIEAANAVVFCLSPDWSASAECHREYDRAVELGKRLLPVLVRDGGAVPHELAALQRIDARPGTDPAAVADAVITAIDVDHERVQEHTEWLSVAVRWDKRGRGRAQLLRGKDLRAAEKWISRGGVGPTPIPLQHTLVTASRGAERRRMLTALAVTLITLALTATLAVVAIIQRTEAVTQRDQARSPALAAAAQAQLDVDPERALLLASAAWSQAPTSQAVTALRSSVERSRIRVRVAAHRDMVSGLVWSDDGRTVVSSGRDGTVAAWDAATGASRGALHLGTDAIEKLVGSSAGVAITGQGHAVLWSLDPANGTLTQRAVLAESGATDAAVDHGVIALGMADGTVRIMTTTGQQRTTVRWGSAVAHAVALAADGGVLLVGADDGTTSVGRIGAARPVVLARDAETVQLSADGATALLAASDGLATLNATADGHRIRPLPTAFQAAVDPSGSRAVIAQNDGQISLSLASGRTVPLLERGIATADVRFSADGSQVLAATLDGVIRVWSSADGSPLALLRGDGSSTQQATLSPDDRRLATGHNDGTVRLWAMPEHPLPLPVSGGTGVDFAPDGQTVVTAGVGARTWDARTGRETAVGDGCRIPRDAGCLVNRTLLLHGPQLSRAAYSPDGQLIATSSLSGRLALWAASTADGVARAPDALGPIDDIAFSPNGKLLATAERSGSARLVDPRTGAITATVRDPGGEPIDAVAFTGDGSALLTVDDSGSLQRWDTSGDGARTIAQVGEMPLRMAVDPLGRYVAIGTITRIHLIDLASGRTVRTLVGHTGFVTGVAFSPDGNLLFSGGKDGTVREWDVPSGEQAGLEQIPGGDVSYIAVDGTGRRVAAVTTEGAGYIVDCEYCGSPDELAKLAAEHATRVLSDDERATFDVP